MNQEGLLFPKGTIRKKRKNYPISMANGWNYVKQQLNDNRDYIYDMDLQSAEAYVNSEYAVALTELEV